MHPGQRCLAIKIENERHIWQAIADGEGVDASGGLRRNASRDALIDRGGIKESVADHDLSGFQSGQDFFTNQLRAARGKEQKFGLGHESLALGGMLQKMSDQFAGDGSTRFADQKRLATVAAEFVGQQGDLGGFSATLRTFERDEKTWTRHFKKTVLIFGARRFSKARMNHWLVKQEPTSYPWEQFVKDGGTAWTGVRNFQARNHLRSMRPGDRVLYYHSVVGKEVVGLAEVARAAYPDPTAEEGDWSCVDLKPGRALDRPVTLDQIKAEPALSDIALLRQSRLSVMPLTKTEFDAILRLAKK
jgi:predicted RNA-binding protein with PUA-like domain